MNQTSANPPQLLQQAADCHQSGRLEQALTLCEQVLVQQPANPAALLLQGLVQHQMGDIVAGLTSLRRVVTLYPDYVEAWYNLAVLLEQCGNAPEAITYYERALALRPSLAAAHNNLANLHAASGRFEMALQSQREAVRLQPDYPAFRINLGNILRASGRLADAVAEYQALLARQPDNARAHNYLGIAYKEQNNLTEAERAYRRAITLDPAYAEAWNNAGNVLLDQGRMDEAITAYQTAVGHNKQYAPAHSNLAAAYFRAERLDDALNAVRTALELRPEHAETLFNLAAIQSRQFTPAALAEAEQTARKAIQLDPGHALAHDCLAIVLMKTGRLPQATEAARQAIHLAPNNPRCYETLAGILQTIGDYANAEQALRQAVTVQPDYAPGHRQLGIVLLQRNRPDEALRRFEETLRLDGADQRCLAHKIIAHQMLGQQAEAVALLDMDRFIAAVRLECPAGYSSLQQFNAALAEDIRRHPSLQWEPVGLAARGGSLARDLLQPATPAIACFEQLLRRSVESYQDKFQGDPEHPFLRRIPREFKLNLWATLLENGGIIDTHIHEESWLSGAYYVQVPDTVSEDAVAHAGWIEFGRPALSMPETYQPELRHIRPEPGLLLLFPSYFYHRTMPFGSREQRISISFDLRALS